VTPERSDDAPPAPRSGVINSAAYCDGVRVAVVPIPDLGDAWRHSDRFFWVGLYEPSEPLLAHLQQAFGLHDLAIEDAHRAHQRPKLEMYADSMFVVLRTARLCEGGERRIEFGETHVFVGPRYVVTVRHGSLTSHVGLRARCEASPQLLAKGEGFVLHALMDLSSISIFRSSTHSKRNWTSWKSRFSAARLSGASRSGSIICAAICWR
jgi:magnesium transporter